MALQVNMPVDADAGWQMVNQARTGKRDGQPPSLYAMLLWTLLTFLVVALMVILTPGGP